MRSGVLHMAADLGVRRTRNPVELALPFEQPKKTRPGNRWFQSRAAPGGSPLVHDRREARSAEVTARALHDDRNRATVLQFKRLR